jgi:hypothetical protein
LIDSHSDNVKILASKDSRYIYTYDKEKQLFTVYNTEPTKLNDERKREYQLVYLLSLKFDIE